MSKPLILDLKEKIKSLNNEIINVEFLQENFPVNANQAVTYTPNYNSIEGEIVSSVLVGAISTDNNQGLTLTPHIGGIGKEFTKVQTVTVKSTGNATIYVTILVFTKKKTESEVE